MLTLFSSKARLAFSCQLQSYLLHSYKQQGIVRRTLLTPAFSCDAAWRARLSAPEFSATSGASGLDLGNGLRHSLDRREPVASVDIDVYVNKLDSFEPGYLDFFAAVLAKFRCTQEALAKLESTDHALVRCMISTGRAELLVDWLRDKFTYGIFLDQYSASLLIDHFLEAANTRLAALVSFDHALQDGTMSDELLCNAMMLLACATRVGEQLPTWCAAVEAGGRDGEGEGAGEEEEEEDDPDTKHVIVDYIRLPNYDGYFDLDEERLQIGHTLVCLSRRLVAEQQSQLGLTCSLVGLAALEKPHEISRLLQQQISGKSAKLAISRSVAEAVDGLLASARVLPEGKTESDRRGIRPLSRPEALEAARTAVRGLTILPDNGQQWHEEAATYARRLVREQEAKAGQQLAALYSQFEAARLAELRSHGDWLRRRRLFNDVKSQLNSLVEEQEAITAFDKSAEIRYATWLSPRTHAEARVSSKQIWEADKANANRVLDNLNEAARKLGSGGAAAAAFGSAGNQLASVRLRRNSARREKLKPLKE